MRRFEGTSLVVATHNPGKLREIEALLRPYGVALTSNADHGLPQPEETAETFAGNALLKARAAMNRTGLPALADDSGLSVEALGGAPGVQTADWAETGDGRDHDVAMVRVQKELVAIEATRPWRARFCCSLALVWPDAQSLVVEGIVEGQIVWPPRGKLGHGYDPIFQPDGATVTFGEMEQTAKNLISHRAIALSKLVSACFA